MTICHAIILGIVEGITEFLPISSTGHLILVSDLLRIVKSDFLSSFEIGIQLGAILSVVVLYVRRNTFRINILKPLVIAFLPAVFFGILFYNLIKIYLLNNPSVVLWSLLIGGVAIIIFELFYKEKAGSVDQIDRIGNKQALTIGLFQCLAMIPGVSRAAATIIGGLTIGLKRKAIVEFSFLLAIPTMLAATGLDLVKTSINFSVNEWTQLCVGFAVSFVVALAAIKFLLKFIQNHSFITFGIYRIIVALLFWLIILK